MNTFKGTPGEFFVETDSLGNNTQVYAKPYKWIAGVTGQAGKIGSIPENEANAKLFAASKQMMEALQELLRFRGVMEGAADKLQYPDNYLKAIDDAKAALSAALD